MSSRNAGDITGVGQIVSEKIAYNNPFLRVIERAVQMPDGTVREPQFIWDRQGKIFIIVVGVTPEGQIVLVEEPKYGQMEMMTVAVAGGVKKGEEPSEAAQREFFEETGYRADAWVCIRQDPIVDFPDKVDGAGHVIFLAVNARPEGKPENQRKVLLVSREDVRKALCNDGSIGLRINVAMSFVALSIALNHI